MLKFDVIQVFINASAAIGISVLWFEFSKKVFKKVCQLAAIGQIKTAVMRKKKNKIQMNFLLNFCGVSFIESCPTTLLSQPDKKKPCPTKLLSQLDNLCQPEKKTISILLDSSTILALGAYCYWFNKRSLNFALSLFDHIVDTIGKPKEKKTE